MDLIKSKLNLFSFWYLSATLGLSFSSAKSASSLSFRLKDILLVLIAIMSWSSFLTYQVTLDELAPLYETEVSINSYKVILPEITRCANIKFLLSGNFTASRSISPFFNLTWKDLISVGLYLIFSVLSAWINLTDSLK